MDGLYHLPGSEVVFTGPNWSCSCGLSLPPEPSWQNGFKQAAAANLLNVSTRCNSVSSAAAGGKRGCYQRWCQVPGHAAETDTIQLTELTRFIKNWVRLFNFYF